MHTITSAAAIGAALILTACSSSTPAATTSAKSSGASSTVGKAAASSSGSRERDLQTAIIGELKSVHGVTLPANLETSVRRTMTKECADYAEDGEIAGPSYVDRYWSASTLLTKEQAGFLMLRTLNEVCKVLHP